MATIGRPPKSLEERFWVKVDKNGSIPTRCPELGPCWIWKGRCDTRPGKGYGQVWSGGAQGTQLQAHRVGYQIQNGKLGDDQVVRHRCDNQPCVRGTHLLAGTQAENIADRDEAGRAPAGERNGRAKLSVHHVYAIRWLRAKTRLSQERIANCFDISQTHVSKIVLKQQWIEA